MNQNEFNQLKEAYQVNPVLQLICEHFANRTRNQWYTKVDTLVRHLKAEDHEIRRHQVIKALKILDSANAGKYVPSKYGSRFDWCTSSKSLSEHLIENEDLTWDANEDDAESHEEAVPPSVLLHKFHLREDFIVEIELPADLTEAEAYRLSSFTGALSFGDEE